METFEPHRRLRNGHAMTLWAWARRREFPQLPAPADRLVEVAADARVLAHCYFHRDVRAHPTLIVLHGLEGSSTAHYMRGVAAKGWAAGFNVALLNQRNCGGTEHLAATLYHSGLTADVDVLLRQLTAEGHRSIVVAGYSLGGNLALKLAGDYGATPPAALRGAVAVSPVMDLPRCVDALERRSNVIYQWNFVRNLKGRMRRKAALFPDEFSVEPLGRIWTVRQFDEVYTAPYYGFRDATDYYHRASAMRGIERIAVPTLILTAENDPFVPPAPFRDPAVTGNRHITAVITREGGHCAFIEASGDGYDGYWAEKEVVRFATAAWQDAASAPSRTRDLSLPLRA